MTTTTFLSNSHRQRGAATLFITLAMLLVAGLVLLYTSRGAITEQRLSANEMRSKQAFAAASAGLDYAFAYMSSGGIDQKINATSAAGHDGNVDVLITAPLTFSNASYSATFCKPSTALPACPSTSSAINCSGAAGTGVQEPPTDFKDVVVVACGWSDDSTAVHRITQRIQGTPSIPGNMPNPLISKGAVTITNGGPSIFNYFTDLTIWSGGLIESGAANTKTYVRDSANSTYALPNTSVNTSHNDNPDLPDYLDLSGGTSTCTNRPGYTCSTKGENLGFDTIMGDTQLSSNTDDQFFERFLGSSPNAYLANSVSYKIDLNSPATLSGANSTSASSLDGLQAETVWVAGDLTIPANSTVGTKENPVILVVDGDFNFSNNFTIYGIVYVRGDINGNGGPIVYGAMVAEGVTNISGGNPSIVFTPLDDGSGLHDGIPTKIQGSWKDW